MISVDDTDTPSYLLKRLADFFGQPSAAMALAPELPLAIFYEMDFTFPLNAQLRHQQPQDA